jgi:hypothetical protein
MKLFTFGIIAILGLGGLFALSLQASPVGLLTFSQVMREQYFVADFNPCIDVRCENGKAEYVGNTPDTNTIRCQCPDGIVKVLRDRIPKRMYS